MWIQTFTGKRFDLLDPKPEQIDLRDIAHSLSQICRFGGHTEGREIYSVAQHSYWCSYFAPSEHALAALMHDAHEAYIGDVTQPVKWVLRELCGNAFKEWEDRLQRAVFEKFELAWPLAPEVHSVDIAMLATEKRDVLPASVHQWDCELPAPFPKKLHTYQEPSIWKANFLKRFRDLNRARQRGGA